MAKQGAMQKFMDWMQEHIMPVAGKIAEEKHITAITKGMMATIPLTIIGGISLILAYPPVDATTLEATSGILKSCLTAWYNWAGTYAAILELPNNVTLGLLGIYVVIAITYHLCKNYKMEPLSCMITSAMSFLIIAAPPAAVRISRAPLRRCRAPHGWPHRRWRGCARGSPARLRQARSVA